MEYTDTAKGLQTYLISLVDWCRSFSRRELKVYTRDCPFIGGADLTGTYQDPYPDIIRTVLRYYSQQGISISITFMNDHNTLPPRMGYMNWYYNIKIKQLYER